MSRTLYEIIGVNSNADVKEIEQKCLELGKKYNPRANPDDLDAAIIYKEIMTAYATLRDPAKRSAYDTSIKNAKPSVKAAPITENRSVASNNFKEKANSAVGWIFGSLAFLMALPMFLVSFMAGLPYLIIGLMLLPPAREYAYSKTKITLSSSVKTIAIIVLFGFSVYFGVTSSDKSAEEDAVKESQKQSASLAATRQKNAEFFKQNSASILEQVKKLVDEKKYAEALAASTKYLSSKNIELKKLHDIAYEQNKKEKTEKVLAEISKTPESDLTKLAELYAQLASINPEVSEYKEKNKTILGRIEWNKGKEIAAQPSSSGDKYAGKIDPSALYAYTKQGGFEKTISKYGSRLKEIERFRRKAAEKAIDSGKCDSVVTSELSDSKSSLKHLEFWVDCNNGERIYLDENQLKNGGEVVTQKEKVVGEADAMTACIDGIKANASFPSSVDIHYLSGKSYYVAPTTSNVVLKMDFDAKNALGAELPYRAVCTFPAGGEPSIEIHQR